MVLGTSNTGAVVLIGTSTFTGGLTINGGRFALGQRRRHRQSVSVFVSNGGQFSFGTVTNVTISRAAGARPTTGFDRRQRHHGRPALHRHHQRLVRPDHRRPAPPASAPSAPPAPSPAPSPAAGTIQFGSGSTTHRSVRSHRQPTPGPGTTTIDEQRHGQHRQQQHVGHLVAEHHQRRPQRRQRVPRLRSHRLDDLGAGLQRHRRHPRPPRRHARPRRHRQSVQHDRLADRRQRHLDPLGRRKPRASSGVTDVGDNLNSGLIGHQRHRHRHPQRADRHDPDSPTRSTRATTAQPPRRRRHRQSDRRHRDARGDAATPRTTPASGSASIRRPAPAIYNLSSGTFSIGNNGAARHRRWTATATSSRPAAPPAPSRSTSTPRPQFAGDLSIRTPAQLQQHRRHHATGSAPRSAALFSSATAARRRRHQQILAGGTLQFTANSTISTPLDTCTAGPAIIDTQGFTVTRHAADHAVPARSRKIGTGDSDARSAPTPTPAAPRSPPAKSASTTTPRSEPAAVTLNGGNARHRRSPAWPRAP